MNQKINPVNYMMLHVYVRYAPRNYPIYYIAFYENLEDACKVVDDNFHHLANVNFFHRKEDEDKRVASSYINNNKDLN